MTRDEEIEALAKECFVAWNTLADDQQIEIARLTARVTELEHEAAEETFKRRLAEANDARGDRTIEIIAARNEALEARVAELEAAMPPAERGEEKS